MSVSCVYRESSNSLLHTDRLKQTQLYLPELDPPGRTLHSLQVYIHFLLCVCVSCRAAKMSAQKRISEFGLVTPRGRKEETEEGSDDSLIGEHSPFVRQPAKKYCLQIHTYTSPLILCLFTEARRLLEVQYQCWTMMMMIEKICNFPRAHAMIT